MQLAYILLLCSLHMCTVHTFCTQRHIIACNLSAGCMQFAYILHMCMLHYVVNGMYAISEFAYVRSLQLGHA